MDKKPHLDIYKELKKNQRATWAYAIGGILITLSAIVASAAYSYKFSQLTVNKILAINDNGEVFPLKLMEREKKLKLEIFNNIADIADRGYTLNFVTVDNKPNTLQWLLSKNDYKTFKGSHKKWFYEIKQKKLIQVAKVETDSIQINGEGYPYKVSFTMLLTISDGYSNKYFRQKVSADLIPCEAEYPKNRHGFLATNYNEENLTELK